MDPGTLHFLCGKMAAGKSTFARVLARTHEAILLEEDHFLATLFGGEIHSVADYLTYSGRIRNALSEHVVTLLRTGTTVVLDFPGNTSTQRAWFRQLIDRAEAGHELHYLDVSDDVCKAQLRVNVTRHRRATGVRLAGLVRESFCPWKAWHTQASEAAASSFALRPFRGWTRILSKSKRLLRGGTVGVGEHIPRDAYRWRVEVEEFPTTSCVPGPVRIEFLGIWDTVKALGICRVAETVSMHVS